MKNSKEVRRLVLTRETVRELRGDELRQAAGGIGSLPAACADTLPLTVCQCTGTGLTYQGCN